MNISSKFLENIKKDLNEPDNWDDWNRSSIIGNRFLGVWTEKNPSDAWRYQEIIFEKKPDIIIESGSFKGGSAYYLAKVMDMVGNGRIISVDNRDNGQNEVIHPRIKFIINDILNCDFNNFGEHEKVMLILDSDHNEEHVYKELQGLSGLVTNGQYLIIEDTVIQRGINAVDKFLKDNNTF